jgi:hypothetical protein
MSALIPFRKKRDRPWQSYHWRSYDMTEWKFGEETPLLVYASSWDDGHGGERFCGAVDLSMDEAATRELLGFSPHYYMITYKLTDN